MQTLTVLMISFGWRWMFVSMGLLGIVVAIVWYTVYREVAEAALSSGEAHHLTEGEEEPPQAQHVTLAEWGQLFGFRVTGGLILGFFGIVYMVWLFLAWLPGYLEIQRHMRRSEWRLARGFGQLVSNRPAPPHFARMTMSVINHSREIEFPDRPEQRFH